MAYSTKLEERIDRRLNEQADLEKKKMFGGVGYLLGGNICFGIYKDDLILRTTPDNAEGYLKHNGFKPFDITGKAMSGWVMVEPAVHQIEEELQRLLQEGIGFASALPRK
ncbi:MAG: TfoX/Sxy family protein [Balneolaceae bacterium]|nr:TfoX/Sxy family protein [Balneolaceae bacterium]